MWKGGDAFEESTFEVSLGSGFGQLLPQITADLNGDADRQLLQLALNEPLTVGFSVEITSPDKLRDGIVQHLNTQRGTVIGRGTRTATVESAGGDSRIKDLLCLRVDTSSENLADEVLKVLSMVRTNARRA